jgi:hypothetical protein
MRFASSLMSRYLSWCRNIVDTTPRRSLIVRGLLFLLFYMLLTVSLLDKIVGLFAPFLLLPILPFWVFYQKKKKAEDGADRADD